MPRFRTIVADPPWDIGDFPRNLHARGLGNNPCPYPVLTVEEIADVPLAQLAHKDAHLYLWTTNQFLESAYFVARSWGFTPVKILVWVKAPKGRGLGGTFASATEYVLFCRRGAAQALSRVDRNWWCWKRGRHSAKPEQFQDIVEQVSPGPYLEMFARRPRAGWSIWGDEVESDIDLKLAT